MVVRKNLCYLTLFEIGQGHFGNLLRKFAFKNRPNKTDLKLQIAQWLGPPHKLFFVFVFFWSWGGRTSLLSYLYYFVSVFMVIKTMKMAKIDQFRT